MLEIKTEIVNLVRFFNAISVSIRFVMEKYVNPYADAIKAGKDGDRVGPYSMLDFQRSVSRLSYGMNSSDWLSSASSMPLPSSDPTSQPLPITLQCGPGCRK
jgi:hypothetical protein